LGAAAAAAGKYSVTRDQRRADLCARVQSRLAEQAARPIPPPAGPPCCDDEHEAGVAWLDRLAKDDVWPDAEVIL
jgi:hypothetical protein